VLAIAEACWPEGLRPGQGNPVILVLDPAETDLDRLKELGYETFTSTRSLRGYARRWNRVAACESTRPLPRIGGAAAGDAKTPTVRMGITALRMRLSQPCPRLAACVRVIGLEGSELDIEVRVQGRG
jgi:hypothetical protein